jgi:riboflavin kinase/FMN adenylyltransferase
VIDAGHDLALYDLPAAVDFVEYLRPMVAFDGIEALLAQMAADVEQAREVTSRG